MNYIVFSTIMAYTSFLTEIQIHFLLKQRLKQSLLTLSFFMWITVFNSVVILTEGNLKGIQGIQLNPTMTQNFTFMENFG